MAAKEATERICVYLSPDQVEKAHQGMEADGFTNPQDWLRSLMEQACEYHGIAWPETVGRGGKRPGAGRKPLESRE